MSDSAKKVEATDASAKSADTTKVTKTTSTTTKKAPEQSVEPKAEKSAEKAAQKVETKPAEKTEEPKAAEKTEEPKAEPKAEPIQETESQHVKVAETKPESVKSDSKKIELNSTSVHVVHLTRPISVYRGPNVNLSIKPFGGSVTCTGVVSGEFTQVTFVRSGYGLSTGWVATRDITQ